MTFSLFNSCLATFLNPMQPESGAVHGAQQRQGHISVRDFVHPMCHGPYSQSVVDEPPQPSLFPMPPPIQPTLLVQQEEHLQQPPPNSFMAPPLPASMAAMNRRPDQHDNRHLQYAVELPGYIVRRNQQERQQRLLEKLQQQEEWIQLVKQTQVATLETYPIASMQPSIDMTTKNSVANEATEGFDAGALAHSRGSFPSSSLMSSSSPPTMNSITSDSSTMSTSHPSLESMNTDTNLEGDVQLSGYSATSRMIQKSSIASGGEYLEQQQPIGHFSYSEDHHALSELNSHASYAVSNIIDLNAYQRGITFQRDLGHQDKLFERDDAAGRTYLSRDILNYRLQEQFNETNNGRRPLVVRDVKSDAPALQGLPRAAN